MVTIGCGRTVKPVTFSVLGKDGKDKAVRGTVSYVHPARRYCILEFAVRGGILRESFQLIDGEIAELEKGRGLHGTQTYEAIPRQTRRLRRNNRKRALQIRCAYCRRAAMARTLDADSPRM